MMKTKLTTLILASLFSYMGCIYSEEKGEVVVFRNNPEENRLTPAVLSSAPDAVPAQPPAQPSGQPSTPPSRSRQRALVEAKVGYFFFTNHNMRRVFDQGGIDVQLSGSCPVYSVLHVYGSVEYLKKSGHSTVDHQKTSLWELPLSLGLQAVFPIGDHVAYYLTLGPRYFFVYVHNHSPYVPHRMSANGCGGFANMGFLFTMGHFTLDLFGEYSYKRLHFHSSKPGTQGHSVQVGGLTFGGGLGYSF